MSGRWRKAHCFCDIFHHGIVLPIILLPLQLFQSCYKFWALGLLRNLGDDNLRALEGLLYTGIIFLSEVVIYMLLYCLNYLIFTVYVLQNSSITPIIMIGAGPKVSNKSENCE